MLDWYKRGLYGVFKWYRQFQGPDSAPHAWATAIYLLCHYANATTALLVYSKLLGKSGPWIISAATKLIAIGAVVSILYCLHFIHVVEQMDEQASRDERAADALEIYKTPFPPYIIVSLLIFVAAIAYVSV